MASATPKTKLVKAPVAHPPVFEMVKAAIVAAKDKKGTSLVLIKRYVTEHYKLDEKKIAPFLRRAIVNGVKSGALVRVGNKGTGASGSFKLGAKAAEAKKAPQKKTTSAAKPAKKASTGTPKKAASAAKPAKKATTAKKSTAAKKSAASTEGAAKPAKKAEAKKRVAKPKKTAAEKRPKTAAKPRKAAAAKPKTAAPPKPAKTATKKPSAAKKSVKA